MELFFLLKGVLMTDKKAILLRLIDALKDDNNQVIVETVDGIPTVLGNNNVNWHYDAGQRNEANPLSGRVVDAKQKNANHAKTIKIGKDITLERLDGANRFAVKINGERVEFGAQDKSDSSYDIEDVRGIWSAATGKYEGIDDYFYRVRNYAPSKELRDALLVKNIEKSKADKYRQSAEKLKAMGVKPTRVEQLSVLKQGYEI